MQKQLLALVLMIACCFTVQAQQKLEEFSENRTEFLTQLEGFIMASQRKILEKEYEAFEKIFKSGAFNDEEFEQIRVICNAMLQKNVNASQMTNYLIGLRLVKSDTSAAGEQRFKEWHVILYELVTNIEGRKTKPLTDFLAFSTKFFDENMLRYSKTGTDWLITAGQYRMRFEENMPVFTFQDTDLMATYKNDSIQIFDTQGKYYPTLNIWKGSGGRATWDRFNLSEDVFVDFPDTYEIEMNTSLYRVSDVKLQYPSYFGNRRVVGDFQDKLVVSNAAAGATYPRFESKKERLEINNIGKGIQYKGGFRLHGTTVYGFATEDGPAEVRIRDENGGLKYLGQGELLTIKQGKLLTGEHVASAFYNGIDSIYHPSVNIRFDIEKKELRMKRGTEGSDRNPFYSSAHNITINVESMNAYLEQDSIVIGKNIVVSRAANNDRRATFESLNYFDENDYNRLQNLSSVNPVAIIAATAKRESTNDLDADFIAKRINSKYSEENIQSLLFDLMERGFVSYNDDNKVINVKEKAFHYADANRKQVDFDGLRLQSQTDSVNATLNLKTNEMNIGGIPYVEFSPTQRVAMKPSDGLVKMGENRNMKMDGRLFAGYSVMEGKGFDFNYNRFQIEMDSIDFFEIYVPTGRMLDRNKPEAISIGSRIENLKGVLLIDAPSNKSGTEDIEIFPSFQSKGNSFVYYDQKEIQNGVYKRDSFYFKLDKFGFNKLDKLSARDVKFDGLLHSSYIFPTFRDELVIREDNSLGFIHNIPGDNYPLYLDKGWYAGEIDLSNAGLLGRGEVEYLEAKVQSEDIVFKPKQMTATAKAFDISEDRSGAIQWPQAAGVDVSIDWKPYQDSMYVRMQEEVFSLFQESDHTLDGTMVVSPGGLKGIGVLDWSKAKMKSTLFSFGAFSASADTTNLAIKAGQEDEIALKTSNVNGKVDFDTKQAAFKANDEFLITALPYNQYETSMNEFEWDMEADQVQFKAAADKLGAFLSVHPDQDSLTFQGRDALYELASNELAIKGVPFIRSADAYIYPDSGLVYIRPNAVMDTLYEAKIVANVVNKNHVINKATVAILGNREYYASGFYEYNIGDRQQEVEFSDIQGKPVGKGALSEKESITRARGTIAPEDTFYIDLKTEFQGDISLSAESKNLFFDGFARLDTDKLPSREWFRVRCEGEKEDLAIKFEKTKNQDAIPLRTGLFLSKETARVYPSIMAPLYFRKDRALFPVTGYMKYDRKKDHFVFADSLKTVRPNSLRGNRLVFKNALRKVEAEGKFNIGSGLKYVSVAAAGTMETQYPIIEDSTAFTMDYPIEARFMAAIDLIVPDKVMEVMTKDLQSYSIESRPVNYMTGSDFYKKGLSELFPAGRDLNNAITSLSSGTLELPNKMNKSTFLFSNLPMKWDPDYQSFVTTGSKIGLASIKGELFNYTYKGYVEFKMPTNEDDRLYIYLEAPGGNFYYFGFKGGILNMTSNNDDFLKELEGLKTKEVIQKMPDGETYELQIVSPSVATSFVRRARAAQ